MYVDTGLVYFEVLFWFCKFDMLKSYNLFLKKDMDSDRIFHFQTVLHTFFSFNFSCQLVHSPTKVSTYFGPPHTQLMVVSGGKSHDSTPSHRNIVQLLSILCQLGYINPSIIHLLCSQTPSNIHLSTFKVRLCNKKSKFNISLSTN